MVKLMTDKDTSVPSSDEYQSLQDDKGSQQKLHLDFGNTNHLARFLQYLPCLQNQASRTKA